MTRQNKTITPSQLAFLSFAYVFSGLALHGVKSVLVIVLCVMCTSAAVALGLIIGHGEGISAALGEMFPLGKTTAATLLAVSCIFPLIFDAARFVGFSSEVYSGTFPPAVFFAVLAISSLLLAPRPALTGKVAEAFSLLAVSLPIFSLFGHFSPGLSLAKSVDGFEALGSFTVPLALACRCEMTSPRSRPDPLRSAAVSSLGALAGGGIYAVCEMFSFPHGNIAEILAVWTFATVRAASAAFAAGELFRCGAVAAAVFSAFAAPAIVLYAKMPLPNVTDAAIMINIFFFVLFFCFSLPQIIHREKVLQ